MSDVIDWLGAEKYVRLTTFKKDGTPVPTPVWLAQDGDALIVISNATTGKIKRLRHTSRVLLAPCDQRGRVAPGIEDVEGVATLDETPEGIAHAVTLIKGRYGFMYTVAGFVNRLRGYGFDHGAQIRITAA